MPLTPDMAEDQLQQFLDKVRQLNAFVALSEADPRLRAELRDCEHHEQVVALARRCGFEIGRRWGDAPPAEPEPVSGPAGAGDWGTKGPSGSWLASPCPEPGVERSEVLLRTPHWRLERIHSCSAASPEGFWYDQREQEWVTLLQGQARLRFAGEDGDRQLRCGDSLLIPAGLRHRVTATDGPPGTIWLALFWQEA